MLTLTLQDIEKLFEPAPANSLGGIAGKLPLLELRLKCLRSLATGLYANGTSSIGSVEEFLRICEEKSISESESSESESEFKSKKIKVGIFNTLLCQHIPAFRDLRGGMEIAKRSQLTIGMLHGDKLVEFEDIENLTVFADYRLPQLFRSRGVMEVIDGNTLNESASKDQQLCIPAHSRLEICVRAATLVIAEKMRILLQEKRATKKDGVNIKSCDLDYFLWRKTVQLDNKGVLLPFHKTRTFSY